MHHEQFNIWRLVLARCSFCERNFKHELEGRQALKMVKWKKLERICWLTSHVDDESTRGWNSKHLQSDYFMSISMAAWRELVREVLLRWTKECGPLQMDLHLLSGNRVPHNSRNMGFSTSLIWGALTFLDVSCDSCNKLDNQASNTS